MTERSSQDDAANDAELELKKLDNFFNPLNKVIKISFWICFALFICLVSYLEYQFIFKQVFPRFKGYWGYLTNFSFCFLICFYAIKNFLIALKKRMTLKILADLLTVDGSHSDLASLRISHNNLYISSHVALFIFGLSLAFILHKYGNMPLVEAETLLSKPGALLCIGALIYYVLTRVFYYFRNKSLDDAVFYAQIEHYKERYYKEKAEKEQLDSKSEI
ncbi:hypothetical protein [Acinetobacter sp. HZNU-JH01]|uniref:hypothetical protein n=1 Tax=Acinetobacter sp. HZNU-JH01 TaxID=3136280 RepID=UPI0030F3D1C4